MDGQTDQFRVDFKVRDYECDIQGIVNNSVYQNYLEHARHEYLLMLGLHFAELSAKGVNLVVRRAELDYVAPLRSGDHFFVTTKAIATGRVRGEFIQEIYKLVEGADAPQLMTKAIIGWACINEKGRPFAAPEIKQLLNQQKAN